MEDKLLLLISIIITFSSCSNENFTYSSLKTPYLKYTDFVISNDQIIYIDTNYVVRNQDITNEKLNYSFEIKKKLESPYLKIINNLLFIGGNEDENYWFWILDSQTGNILETQEIISSTIYYSPLLYNNSLVFISSSGKIIFFNLSTKSITVFTLEVSNKMIYPGNLILTNNKLYTTSRNFLFEFDLNRMIVTDTISLNIDLPDLYFNNLLCGDNIIIPNDQEILVFNLEQKIIIKELNLFEKNSSTETDYLCGLYQNGEFIYFKTLSGHLYLWNNKTNEFISTNFKLGLAPIQCSHTIGVYGNNLINIENSLIQKINLEDGRIQHLNINTELASKILFNEDGFNFINHDSNVYFIPYK